MKRHNTRISGHRSWLQNVESLATANFSYRERARHWRLAGTTIPIFILFLLTQFPQAITNQNPAPLLALYIELGVCILALFLNWKGHVTTAGILTLIAAYTQGTFTMLHYPEGLTVNDLYLLDLTIIPNVLVLAFFSAKSLFPIVCLNVIQIWTILMYGPHDSTLTHQLQTTAFQTLFHIYALQLVTALSIYLLAYSAEHALAHACETQDGISFEVKIQEQQQQELEKKRQLDDGIQQILQTHVAVANGDLSARAPLHKDHDLWQVASTLNNLIARLQSQSNTIHELKQQIRMEHKRTDHSLKAIKQQREPENTGISAQHPRIVSPPKSTRKLVPKPPRLTSER